MSQVPNVFRLSQPLFIRRASRATHLITALASVTLMFGCGEMPGAEGDANGDGAGGSDGVSVTSTMGIGAQLRRANVMLLVDRSGSMSQPGICAEATCPSKWQQLTALGPYLSEVKRGARLGMALFPSPSQSGCSVDGSVVVPLTDDEDVDQRILTAWDNSYPGGQTPIAAALDQIGALPEMQEPGRDNVLVVLTDGRPNCSCANEPICEANEAVAAVSRLCNRPIPLNTFIVGFGATLEQTAGETLSAMAEAAGAESVPGQPSYYQASTIEELIGLMYQVQTQMRSCTFDLDSRPAPSDLVVWYDNQQLQSCAEVSCSSGYTYDSANGVVELQGSHCDGLNDGNDHAVWFDSRNP